MTDQWFDNGRELIMKRIAHEMRIDQYTVEQIYSKFSEFSLAGDYDVEKEVFWNIVHGAFD